MEAIYRFLPLTITEQLRCLPSSALIEAEEIRLRINRPVEVTSNGSPVFLPYLFSAKDAIQLMDNLSGHSIYTLDEELRRGYVTVEGGHRVGLAGKVILENGHVKALRSFSSFNIRIAREKIGAAEPLIPMLFEEGWKHTMIIGAPMTGKTTLLRDLARIISGGHRSLGIPPLTVGIVDERSEIAGCVDGVPNLQFGPRVDVLDACPKAEGMMMMIRSLSPDVLVVDEIGRSEDREAILEAANAGITLMMTTHGKDLNEIQKRPLLKEIIEHQIFDRFVELSNSGRPGTVFSVRDGIGKEVDIHA